MNSIDYNKNIFKNNKTKYLVFIRDETIGNYSMYYNIT